MFEPHVEPVHFEPAHERPALKPRNERAFTAPREHVRDGFVDKAVAEIMARQRVLESAVPPRRQRTLDGGASAEPPPAQRAVDKAAAELAVRQHVIDNELAARQRVIDNDVGAEAKAPQEALNREAPGQDAPDQGAPDREAPKQEAPKQDVPKQDAPDNDLTSQITARRQALAAETAVTETSFSEREPLPLSSLPPEAPAVASEQPPAEGGSTHEVDLSGLEQQLREITMRIETLRPTAELETAINGLRADLAEIGRSLTEALPRHAVESLEIEIKALGQRIDHSRQTGADTAALASLERGLSDVRETLRTLRPAESLVGFDETVRGLTQKVDAIAAKDDPATLQQLEAAISELRGIVSHVASNDTLAKVAEEVRALAAKIDDLAANAASAPALSKLENRIDVLATALNASTEAGHAVPRELERLLSGLIEKLEWVQLTHTDHTAMAHLEDRIATLVKRLDASNSRLGLLEGVERGLADLLVHIDYLRSAKSEGDAPASKPVAAEAINHEVARTQDSLEAVQGTVEHVVDRLAMIESDMRVDRARIALSDAPMPVEAQAPPPVPPPVREPAPMFATAGVPEVSLDLATELPVEPLTQPEPVQRRLAVARAPIDPNLPPDHPLEPGFTAAARSRNPPSAAVRIAASEAAIESKPPVIPDPGGGKSDFIAAARRAARAAALATPPDKSTAALGGGSAQPKKLTDRVRTLMVAAAVVVIVVGGFHIVSRMLEDGGSGSPSPAPAKLPAQTMPPVHTMPPAPQTEPRSQPELSAPETVPLHVQTESPALPAGAATEANPQPAPTPPGGDSAPRPDTALPPITEPGAAPTANPANRSQLDPGGRAAPVVAGALPKTAKIDPAWSAADVTGSLPQAPLAHNAAPSPAMDKLPGAIGSAALRSAALAGDPSAAYEVAVRLAEGRAVPQDDAGAAHWFERAAKKGLAPAQFRLASLYEKGIGVKKSLATARDLYRAAADKGHGKAMHNLAVLYAEGIDGPADYRTAAHWFGKAADLGITDSQYNLAILYARGVGVEQNFAESFKWFFLAAEAGDKDAAQKRDEMAARLDEQSLAEARIEVEKWAPQRQPAEAVTVKGGWEPVANLIPAAKPKARSSAKASVPDAAKTN